MQRLEPALCPTFADDPPHLDRFGKAFELKRSESSQFKEIANQTPRAVGYDDRTGLGDLLQTSREIGRFSGYGLLFGCAFAEQVAHYDKARGNADACCQLDFWTD
jgi:hypothetical protein